METYIIRKYNIHLYSLSEEKKTSTCRKFSPVSKACAY